MAIRGHQRQSHLEVGGVMRRSNQRSSEAIRGHHTSRAVASTIGTSLRRRASNAVPARIERLASALTNSVRSYCKSGRARAIRGHQRQSEAIRVGKGSCNQRPSQAIKSRVRAIRGRHGRSERIRVSERQSRDSHMQSCGNQRQPEAIGCALRCNREEII